MIKMLTNFNELTYDPDKNWSPQLYIENSIGDIKEEITYKLEQTQNTTWNRNRISKNGIDVQYKIDYTYNLKWNMHIILK